MRGVYRLIAPPERLVFTFAWDDDNGAPGHETLVTLTLAARGDETALTFRQATFPSASERASHEVGWSECLERLSAYVLSV